jgi:hypothetical protein
MLLEKYCCSTEPNVINREELNVDLELRVSVGAGTSDCE